MRLNLPGTKEYNPSEGWLTKRRKDGTLASDLVDFVDDERVVGSGEDRVREAGHALSTRESYLGLQDALRKLRPATRQPGAWAGVVVHNEPELGIVVLTSQEKWDRTKAPVYLWNDRIFGRQTSEEEADVLSVLRQFAMRVYRRRLLRECIAFLHWTHGGTWLTIDEMRKLCHTEGVLGASSVRERYTSRPS